MKTLRLIEILCVSISLLLFRVGVAHSADSEAPIQMVIGESVFITANHVDRIAVANPGVADALLLPNQDSQIMINAKSQGFTNLNVWDKDGQHSYRIFVSLPAVALKTYVYQLKFYSLSRTGYDTMNAYVTTDTDKDSVAAITALLTPLVGADNVSVDAYNNLVTIRGTDSAIEAAREVLETIDKPAGQVVIEARFVELSKDDLKQIGVSMTAARRRALGLLNLDTGSTGTFTFDTFSNLTKHFGITFDLLNQLTTGNTLTNPRVTCRDGSTAMILVGQKYPIATRDQYNLVTYTYIDTGIILAIRPHIADDGSLSLWVKPEVSLISGWVGDPLSSTGNAAPIIDSREAVSELRVQDGEPIVIGGLKRTMDSVTRSKVPYVGDMPVIGSFFRKKHTDKSSSELVIVIIPHIMKPGDKVTQDGVPISEVPASVTTPVASAQVAAPAANQEASPAAAQESAPSANQEASPAATQAPAPAATQDAAPAAAQEPAPAASQEATPVAAQQQ